MAARDPWDEFEDAPGSAAPVARAAPAADPWAEFEDAPAARATAAPPPAAVPPQVAQVQQAAARRPPAPPAPPKDPRETSQMLGFAKGVTGLPDRLMRRLESVPGVDLNDPTYAARSGMGGAALQALSMLNKGLNRGMAQPAIAEAEKTKRPGGIGEFLGETVASLPLGGPITQGAVSGFANSEAPMDWKPESMARLATDTGIGAVTGKVGDVVGGKIAKGIGDQVVKAATKFKPDKAIPVLRKAKDDAYQAVRDLGVVYTPEATQRLEQQTLKTIHDFGASKVLDSTAFRRAQQLTDKVKRGLPLTLDEVETMKQEVYKTVTNPELRGRMAKQFNDFINAAGPNDIAVPGGGALAQQGKLAIDAARNANKKFANVDLLDTKLRGAESKAKRVYSGGGLDNKIRQVFGPLGDADSKKNIERFLHPESFSKLQEVVEGTPFRNAMRLAGSFQPFSLKGAVTSAMTGHVSAVPALMAKHVANTQTRKAVSDLMEMIAAGGTKKAMLAEQQLRSLAARNSGVGKFLTAVEKDIGELTGQAANQGQQEFRKGREQVDRGR